MSAPNMIGVRVAMQSAIATAQPITAISKANPGVASSVSHGLANGDYTLIAAQGMTQVNNRIFRAAGIIAGTSFQLEGEDTSGYDTLISGTSQKLTFGTVFSSLADISAAGGDFDMIDTTTIHDIIKSQEPGMASASVFTFDSYWDVSDTAVQAAMAASTTRAQRAFLFTFQNGFKMAFYGHIGASGLPKASVGQKIKTTIVITASGVPTYFTN